MYIDKCNVARRTKKLEELGYIRRETGKVDRRQNNLYLTEEGEKQKKQTDAPKKSPAKNYRKKILM